MITANGLVCKRCGSVWDWDQCMTIASDQMCPENSTHCFVGHGLYKDGMEKPRIGFAAGCMIRDEATTCHMINETLRAVYNIYLTGCKVSICDLNMCNTARPNINRSGE